MNASNNNPSTTSVLRNLVISVSILTLYTACIKELPEYQATVPPIRIGEYQIQEESDGETLVYPLVLHWSVDQGQGYLEFCNFHNRQISLKARYNDDSSFSIPMQDFKTDFEELRIYQGGGIFTPEGFELNFWGDLNGIAITSSLFAKYPQ